MALNSAEVARGMWSATLVKDSLDLQRRYALSQRCAWICDEGVVKRLLELRGFISSCLSGSILPLDLAFSTLVNQSLFPSRIVSCQHSVHEVEAADCMLEWRKRILRAVRSCLDFCSHA